MAPSWGVELLFTPPTHTYVTFCKSNVQNHWELGILDVEKSPTIDLLLLPCFFRESIATITKKVRVLKSPGVAGGDIDSHTTKAEDQRASYPKDTAFTMY